GLFLGSPQYLTLNDLTRELPVIRIGSISTTGTPGSYFRSLIGLLNNTYGQGVAFTLPTRELFTPYAQHFHLTIEREIATNIMVSAGYVGSRGVHLTRFRSPSGGLSGRPDFEVVRSTLFPACFDFKGKTASPARAASRRGACPLFEYPPGSRYSA